MATKPSVYFYTALLCAIWFALSASAWTYLINVVIALPFGLLSLLLWHRGKKIDTRVARYKVIPVILVTGMAISVFVLILFLIHN